MKNTNRDLLPNNNSFPLNADRVWNICELLCYRARSETKNPIEKQIYSSLADEILEIRKEWERWEKIRTNIANNPPNPPTNL